MNHDADEFAYVQTIIAKCSKAGETDWFCVSEETGMDLLELRQAYDLDIPEADPKAWQACGLPLLTIRNHPQGAPLKRMIFKALITTGSAISTLAGRFGTTSESVRVRMNQLSKMGHVQHDGRFPRTWSLTEEGRIIAQALRTLPGSDFRTGKAA